jgi:hypothetical protein
VDFDIHVRIPLEQLMVPVLEKLVKQFGAQVVAGKKETKAFRDVFSHVTPLHDRTLARLLDDEDCNLIIARRCLACFVGAEHPALQCGECGSELGMVAYENEEQMEQWHWEKPARLKPGKGLYCWCDEEGVGDMVMCDGPQCWTKWFHLGCIGLAKLPEGKWVCGDCITESNEDDCM